MRFLFACLGLFVCLFLAVTTVVCFCFSIWIEESALEHTLYWSTVEVRQADYHGWRGGQSTLCGALQNTHSFWACQQSQQCLLWWCKQTGSTMLYDFVACVRAHACVCVCVCVYVCHYLFILFFFQTYQHRLTCTYTLRHTSENFANVAAETVLRWL